MNVQWVAGWEESDVKVRGYGDSLRDEELILFACRKGVAIISRMPINCDSAPTSGYIIPHSHSETALQTI